MWVKEQMQAKDRVHVGSMFDRGRWTFAKHQASHSPIVVSLSHEIGGRLCLQPSDYLSQDVYRLPVRRVSSGTIRTESLSHHLCFFNESNVCHHGRLGSSRRSLGWQGNGMASSPTLEEDTRRIYSFKRRMKHAR